MFNWLQEAGQVQPREMLRTFNCGIGMVVILPAEGVDSARAHLTEAGIESWVLGQIGASEHVPPHVELITE